MAEPARFGYRGHLVRLVARSEAAAARLAVAGDPQRRTELAARARRESARLSARLDASPLRDDTADEVDAGTGPEAAQRRAEPPAGEGPGPAAPGSAAPGSAARSGSWAAALKLEGMPTQEVAAVEYANLLACVDTEREVAPEFFGAPLTALFALHGRLVEGLAAPERVGRVREVEHDVHDGAHGQVLYRTPDPGRLPGLLDSLAAWLGRGSADVPALVVAGVVHGRLLEWQPFDAANGRLARSAARVVLRARGLDPDGLAVPERALAADPLGYFGEVAATIRRRGDLTAWLERSGEAMADALEAAVDALEGGPPDPPPRGREAVAALAEGEAVTVPDYERAVGVDRDTATTDLEGWRRAGMLALEPGTQGLRYYCPPRF